MSNPSAADQNVPTKKIKIKLSKAERKHLKHLEAMRLKERLIREQLLREIELTKKSLKRGKLEWEDTCRQIKLKEFRDEIEEWGSKTVHLLEKKDEKIDLLLKNIDETQELHERNFSKHLDQLSYLTECHRTLCNAATSIYEMQASEMIQDFMREHSIAQEIQERIKLNTENIMHSSNVVVKGRLRKNYEHYMDRKFDKVTSEIEKRYTFRDETANKMRNLQDQLLLWIKDLQGDMIDVRKTEKFLYFMQRQRNYVQESSKLNEIERISRKMILDLEQELLDIETESTRKIYSLKLEQAYFLQVRSIIKNSIERDKQLTHEKLLAVASESYRVINKLKEIVKNGELILGLGVCCRKYKTEKEKVVPWNNEAEDGGSTADTELMFKMNFDLVKHLDISEEELSDQMSLLKNFWRRCSDVRLHNLLLREEKHKLIEENEKYRNIIRSMKKSDDVKHILEAIEIKQQF